MEALKALEVLGADSADVRKELDGIKRRLDAWENKKAGERFSF